MLDINSFLAISARSEPQYFRFIEILKVHRLDENLYFGNFFKIDTSLFLIFLILKE